MVNFNEFKKRTLASKHNPPKEKIRVDKIRRVVENGTVYEIKQLKVFSKQLTVGWYRKLSEMGYIEKNVTAHRLEMVNSLDKTDIIRILTREPIKRSDFN